MNSIMGLFVGISRRWWAVVLVFGLNFAAFSILFALEDQFEALAGVPTFDTQNDLTADLLREQLPLYVGEARAAYERFAAFDFVFPLVAGVFIAVILTLLLRINPLPIAARLLAWNLPLVPLIGTLWDYLENVSLLTILNAGANLTPTMIDAALLFKRLKLIWLFANGPLIVLVLVLLIVGIVLARRSASAGALQAGRRTD